VKLRRGNRAQAAFLGNGAALVGDQGLQLIEDLLDDVFWGSDRQGLFSPSK
jgi:hypothetical protein